METTNTIGHTFNMIRHTDDADIQVANTWREERGQGTLPDGVLPETGFVIHDNEGAAVMVWLYLTIGSKVAFIDWLVSRPGIPAHRVRFLSRQLFAQVEEVARACGVQYLFCSTSRSALSREFARVGFQPSGESHFHLTKTLI